MSTNEKWPEAFGFTVGGRAPVVILSVDENSVAQRAGLQPGDQILEVNGENVQGLSKEEIILLAKRSRTVPPALAVISRIRTFDLRRRRGRFGFAVRGKGPVFIADVEQGSPAQNVGIRRGDLILRLNGVNLRHMNENQVGEMIDTCGPTISIVLIAGAADIGITDKKEGKSSSSRYKRAKDFFVQMNYYLAGNESIKKELVKALNQYARDRSVEQLAQNLKRILKTPVERKLLRDIRSFIPKREQPLFDISVGMNG